MHFCNGGGGELVMRVNGRAGWSSTDCAGRARRAQVNTKEQQL